MLADRRPGIYPQRCLKLFASRMRFLILGAPLQAESPQTVCARNLGRGSGVRPRASTIPLGSL